MGASPDCMKNPLAWFPVIMPWGEGPTDLNCCSWRALSSGRMVQGSPPAGIILRIKLCQHLLATGLGQCHCGSPTLASFPQSRNRGANFGSGPLTSCPVCVFKNDLSGGVGLAQKPFPCLLYFSAQEGNAEKFCAKGRTEFFDFLTPSDA